MSGLSITFGQMPTTLFNGASSADRGTPGPVLGSVAATPVPGHLPERPRNGCVVIRRITDDLGREWRVRQLWSEHCHGLLFQCTVRGIRSEVRPMRGSLESLTDDELLTALMPADD